MNQYEICRINEFSLNAIILSFSKDFICYIKIVIQGTLESMGYRETVECLIKNDRMEHRNFDLLK